MLKQTLLVQGHEASGEGLQEDDFLSSLSHFLLIRGGPAHHFHLQLAGRRPHDQLLRELLQDDRGWNQSSKEFVELSSDVHKRLGALLVENVLHNHLNVAFPVHEFHVRPSLLGERAGLEEKQRSSEVAVRSLHMRREPQRISERRKLKNPPEQSSVVARERGRDLRSDSSLSGYSESIHQTTQPNPLLKEKEQRFECTNNDCEWEE